VGDIGHFIGPVLGCLATRFDLRKVFRVKRKDIFGGWIMGGIDGDLFVLGIKGCIEDDTTSFIS
jgi:hypothetical protein